MTRCDLVPLIDPASHQPHDIKGVPARFVIDQKFLGPYVIGLGWRVEGVEDHCADQHIRRHLRPGTRHRHVQAHAGRLLFEPDGDDIAEGQIDEFRRRASPKKYRLLSALDFLGELNDINKTAGKHLGGATLTWEQVVHLHAGVYWALKAVLEEANKARQPDP
jgi:hypothetical protein